MAIYYPPAFINGYLADKIPNILGQDFVMPFFPTSPTAIDDITQTFPDAVNNVFAVYDRMLKMRRSPFPHIKNEQLLYYFYKTSGDPVQLIEATQIVHDLLDNEDEAAQAINSWAAAKQASQSPLVDDSGSKRPLPFFHKIRVYQLEETRDIVDFGTARTYAGNKLIIDFEWHKS